MKLSVVAFDGCSDAHAADIVGGTQPHFPFQAQSLHNGKLLFTFWAN